MMADEVRMIMKSPEAKMARALAKSKEFTRLMKYLPSWQGQSIEDWAAEAAESICDDIEEQTVFLERNPVIAFVRYLSDWFEAQLADDDCWEENIEDDELRRIHARAEAIRLVAKWF